MSAALVQLEDLCTRRVDVTRRFTLQAPAFGLAVGDRLGGHFVSGHVDERGILDRIEPRGRDAAWRVGCSPVLAAMTVMKGSVALDGVSLTVSGLGDDWFEVNLIPHTQQVTTFSRRSAGDAVNIECGDKGFEMIVVKRGILGYPTTQVDAGF